MPWPFLTNLLPGSRHGGAGPSSLPQLHTCWDLSRCSTFTVFIHGYSNATRSLALRQRELWPPPPWIRLAASPDEACVVIVPLDSRSHRIVGRPAAIKSESSNHPLEALRQLQGWNGGRNHVVVVRSDRGISRTERFQWLGCAALAQSHCELDGYAPGFDISLPLSLPSAHRSEYGGILGLERLEAIARSSRPGRPRRYFLTFRGSMYYPSGAERRELLLPLARQSTAERPVAIFGRCAGFGHRGAAELCDALKNASSAAPPYLELLNTTFALVPAGESPASMRLPGGAGGGRRARVRERRHGIRERLRAPVRRGRAVARGLLHFPWEAGDSIVRVLERIPPHRWPRCRRWPSTCGSSTFGRPMRSQPSFRCSRSARASDFGGKGGDGSVKLRNRPAL